MLSREALQALSQGSHEESPLLSEVRKALSDPTRQATFRLLGEISSDRTRHGPLLGPPSELLTFLS